MYMYVIYIYTDLVMINNMKYEYLSCLIVLTFSYIHTVYCECSHPHYSSICNESSQTFIAPHYHFTTSCVASLNKHYYPQFTQLLQDVRFIPFPPFPFLPFSLISLPTNLLKTHTPLYVEMK